MKQLILKNVKYLLFFVILQFINISCQKDQDSVIPYVPVAFTINLNVFNDLTVSGNSVYFAGVGYGGIIVYCELPGTYYAFDAACTYEANSTSVVESEGVLGICPECGSQFVFLSGSYPSKGPAKMPLKQYNVLQIDDSKLLISNN